MSSYIREKNITISQSMTKAIIAGDRDHKEVLKATRDFFKLMAKKTPSAKQREKCLQLMQSGNVDFNAYCYKSPTESHVNLYNYLATDPHFCIEAIMLDPVVFGQYEWGAEGTVLPVLRSLMEANWQKSVIQCFEHPKIRNKIVEKPIWWNVVNFDHDPVDFLEKLYELDLIAADKLDIIAMSPAADKCRKLMLEKGWEPSEHTIYFHILSDDYGRIDQLVGVGIDVAVLRQAIAQYQSYKDKGDSKANAFNETFMANLADDITAMEDQWTLVKEKLAAGDMQALHTKDLIIAGNMGDEALRQFVQPKHWRKPEDKAHLLEMLEQAPVQVTSRISNQIEVLKGSNAHSNGWGRGNG